MKKVCEDEDEEYDNSYDLAMTLNILTRLNTFFFKLEKIKSWDHTFELNEKKKKWANPGLIHLQLADSLINDELFRFNSIVTHTHTSGRAHVRAERKQKTKWQAEKNARAVGRARTSKRAHRPMQKWMGARAHDN